MVSQIAMKENPRKSPRVPPTSAINEGKPYNSCLVSTKTKGEVFQNITPDLPYVSPWRKNAYVKVKKKNYSPCHKLWWFCIHCRSMDDCILFSLLHFARPLGITLGKWLHTSCIKSEWWIMFVRPKRDWRTTGFYIAACMSVGLHVYLNEVLVGLNMYRLIQAGSN